MKVPPSLKSWLDGKSKWGSGCSQGLKDWEQSFRTKGHTETADKILALRAGGGVEAKQDFVMKLSIVNTTKSLKAFENKNFGNGRQGESERGMDELFRSL